MNKLRTSLISALLTLVVLIGVGTWSFSQLEGWTYAKSFYFSVATLTTVGYGDVHPTTDETRVFTAIYILIGVGIVIAALTSIGSRYLVVQERELSDSITRRLRRRLKRRSEKK